MYLYRRKKKILLISAGITLAVLATASVCIFFILQEFYWNREPEDPEICIKTRCMPSELFRRSSSSFICSPEDCIIHSSNISEYVDSTCAAMECVTRGDKDKYKKIRKSKVCLDTVCLKASAVVHLKPGGNCSTTDCIVSAGEVLKSMDPTIKPCDDFYRFSCHGTFKNTIPSDQKNFNVDKALNDTLSIPVVESDCDSLVKIKKVYRTCIDETASEIKDFAYLSDVLKRSRIGEWPLLKGKSSMHKNCTAELELRTAMQHVYGVETFFRLDVEFSAEDSTAFIKMSVAPPLFEGICTGGSEDARTKIEKYSEMMNKIFTYIFKDEGKAKRIVEGIKAFDRQFCFVTKLKNHTAEGESTMITLEQLAEMSPHFNWKLWHSLISSEFAIDSRLKNAPFYVYDVHFHINDILDLVERSTSWVNYLSTKFLLSYMGFMDRPLREIMMEYNEAFTDHTMYTMPPVSAMVPRWKQCQKYLQKVMGIALIPPFISQIITHGVEREMEYLAELVKHSFKETFHHSKILYEKEKKQIMKTITKFGVFLLYPDENGTFYDDYYSNMDILGYTFLETGMQVRLYHQKKIFEAVYRGAHDYDLELKVLLQNPFENHALAAITENKTVIFIGGMHVADVKPDVPRYMNFATLGTTIALEYVIGSHLLSDKPGKDTFDIKAKEWRSWPEYIREHVMEKRQCYIDKYYNQKGENGDRVVKEMMANVQALKESLQAYRIYCEKYGHEPLLPIPNLSEKGGDEQLFFILYAQSFCIRQFSQESNVNGYLVPGAKRVNEVLRNLEDFADAFHCPSDSPMNPSSKCGTIW